LRSGFKKDFAAARFIAQKIIESQPKTYDLVTGCDDLPLVEYSSAYIIDAVSEPRSHIQIVSIIDYNPIAEAKAKPIRINFALKDIEANGYCIK
jgi:hypothetical protein